MKIYLIYIACLLITTVLTKPPVVIEPKNPNAPTKLPDGVTKKALIIGAGLAGLSAALELAERGYSVTIKEKHYFGGKLFSEPVEVFPGQVFQIEHGFHAWFHNYFNFQDIRNRLNVNSNFKKWDKVHFLFQHYKPEVIYSSGPYPLNLIEIILRSPNLKLTDAILSILAIPDLVFYDFDHMNAKYDNITFIEWTKEKKVDKPFNDIIMAPALSVTLNDRETFSAAEMLAIIQIYFLSQADSDHREIAIYNFEKAVLKPWRQRLESLNTKILMNTGVKSLKVDPKTLNVYGSVDENGDDKTIYDYVVLAVDVGAAQDIFYNTFFAYKNEPRIAQILLDIYSNSIGKMKVAPQYKVIRVWFDQQLSDDIPDIIETPDYGPINLIAQYHQIEKEFIEWANKTGGSVLEFHCYTWDKTFPANVTDDQVWPLISPTVKLILPQIFDKNFKVLAYHVNSFQNFASYEKGLFNSRPTVDYLTKNSLNNVYLAGDWIKTNYPSALMERAVSTGREAANEILFKDNVRQVSLTVTNPKGPGI